MPISWSEPTSSSEASFDEDEFDGVPRRAFTYGTPGKCWCGQFVKEAVCTTNENRGRRYFTCPASESGVGDHLEKKWWDEAVQEELTTHTVRIGQTEDKLDRIFTDPRWEFIRRSIQELRKEVDKLDRVVHKKDEEISRLKEMLKRW